MKSITMTFSTRFAHLGFVFMLCCLLSNTISAQSNIQQSLSVNSDGSAAHASAQLDVSATDKGILVPRMVSAQRTAIASPAQGLLVFDITTGSFWFFNGSVWLDLSSPKELADGDGNTKVQVEKNFNEDIIRFDLGGTQNMVLRKNATGNAWLELHTSFDNTFVGIQAGKDNTTGSTNAAFGNSALSHNINGNNNTAMGILALSSNTGGDFNTATGSLALLNNTNGDQNTAAGYLALVSNSSGIGNTAIGMSALYDNLTGNYNAAMGHSALLGNTVGSHNTAGGVSALGSNTTGFSNTALGRRALYSNTTRSNLVAVGDSALYSNGIGANLATHSIQNTALGSKSLYANTTGSYNTSAGFRALYSNTTGANNTAHGTSALIDNTSGGINTAVGSNALSNNTNGSNNTGVGANAIFSNTTGSQNTALGNGAYFTTNNLNNTTCIGYISGGISNVSNRIEIGNTSVSWIGGQVNWGTYSDARIKTQVQENVPGLDFIKKLRPVTYHLDIHKQNDLCFRGKKDIGEWEGMYDIEQKQMTGFIAQEVEAAAQAVGYDFSGVEKGVDEVGMYSVKYAEFVVPLVKAVQEQQTIIENRELRIENGELRIESLEQENAALRLELLTYKLQLDKITAALAGAGIAVEK